MTLHKEIGKALELTECRAFIDRLVSFNQGGIYYDSQEDLPAFAEYIYNSPDGGMFFRPNHGGQVGNKFWIARLEPFHLNAQSNAAELMHLLIHGVTKGSDDRLNRNIQQLGIVPTRRDGTPLPLPKLVQAELSSYWDRALKNVCFPKASF